MNQKSLAALTAALMALQSQSPKSVYTSWLQKQLEESQVLPRLNGAVESFQSGILDMLLTSSFDAKTITQMMQCSAKDTVKAVDVIAKATRAILRKMQTKTEEAASQVARSERELHALKSQNPYLKEMAKKIKETLTQAAKRKHKAAYLRLRKQMLTVMHKISGLLRKEEDLKTQIQSQNSLLRQTTKDARNLKQVIAGSERTKAASTFMAAKEPVPFTGADQTHSAITKSVQALINIAEALKSLGLPAQTIRLTGQETQKIKQKLTALENGPTIILDDSDNCS